MRQHFPSAPFLLASFFFLSEADKTLHQNSHSLISPFVHLLTLTFSFLSVDENLNRFCNSFYVDFVVVVKNKDICFFNAPEDVVDEVNSHYLPIRATAAGAEAKAIRVRATRYVAKIASVSSIGLGASQSNGRPLPSPDCNVVTCRPQTGLLE